MGVTKGLAGLKFSTSPSTFGLFAMINRSNVDKIVRGVRSLIENLGWNFILSTLVGMFLWLEDPFSCRSIRWIIIMSIRAIGRRKWIEKKRFRVG